MNVEKKANKKKIKFKDWLPGEYRVTLNIVMEMGMTLDYYLPHLTREQGLEFVKLATDILGKDVDEVGGELDNKMIDNKQRDD